MNAPRQPQRDRTASPLVYMLIFTSFALFALTIFSKRIADRQTKIEQQFHGIQRIQLGGETETSDSNAPPQTDAQPPLIITLRPLMLILAVLMLAAWGTLSWRRWRPSRATEMRNPDS